MTATTSETLSQSANPVKPFSPFLQDLISDSMIHHKVSPSTPKIILYKNKTYSDRRYGVSQAHRLLPPQILLKKHDYLLDCLENVLCLAPAQREVTFRLLRLWSYYGQVYPKEAHITAQPGCSKATFWRTIRKLKAMQLVRVVNRYVIRPHAQISNLYLLDKLAVLLARYLAEHIAHVWPDYLKPALAMPLEEFYRSVFRSPGVRAGPLIAAS